MRSVADRPRPLPRSALRSRGRERPPLVVVVVLLAALATGAAASWIVNASGASALPGRATEVVFPATWIAYGLFVLIGLIVAVFLAQRFTGDHARPPSRAVVAVFVAILVGVGFVFLLHSVNGGGSLFGGTGSPVPPPSNSTTGQNDSNGSLLGGGGGALWSPSLHLPPWLGFVLLVAVVVAAVLFVAPPLVRWVAERDRRSRVSELVVSPEAGAVRGALQHAAEELSRGDDPRGVIEGLYNELLVRLGRQVGGVDPETPEEIRTLHLERLGIRPTVAVDLTRLFEEARYSSHPLGPEAAARARETMGEAITDLDRVTEGG